MGWRRNNAQNRETQWLRSRRVEIPVDRIFLWAGNVFAQSIEEEVAVIELGAAERSLTENNTQPIDLARIRLARCDL